MNYIYIIQIREFLETNIYKIGKTKQINCKRFNQYPKGSKLICQFDCIDCDIIEKKLYYCLKINIYKNEIMELNILKAILKI